MAPIGVLLGRYKYDVPDTDVHIVDAGHFALDEAVDQIATLIRVFLERQHLGAGGANVLRRSFLVRDEEAARG
jgi:hypothetical protein